jgi:DNA-binding transcriptional ArsR family regulator
MSLDDLARTRVAYSPMWEVVAGATLLLDPRPDGPYPKWTAEARRAIAGLDLDPVRALLLGEGYLPDFLLPLPGPGATFAGELAKVRAAPPKRVRHEVRLAYPDAAPPVARPYLDDPKAAVARLAETLEEYWRRTLAPQWPRMRALLEGEVLDRARRVAQHGPDGVFHELSPRIRWRPPRVEVDKRFECDVELGGAGLLLVPLVFAKAFMPVALDVPGEFALSYLPRGSACLWETPGEPAAEPIELLLGRGRAAVLQALGTTSSTSALSLALGVSPSTVSEHLAVLGRAGVVRRRRVGRLVHYDLTETGEALIGLLAPRDAGVRVA